MAGTPEHSGARSALSDGMARVSRAPGLLAAVYVLTLATAVPFAAVLAAEIQGHIGASLTGEHAARGVHQAWWTEFSAGAGPLGSTLQTSIIGFAAVLDNVSTIADRGARPAPIVWAGLLYVLSWLFVTGGILDRYARARPVRLGEFFAACGVNFVRFLRLLPFMALAYAVIFLVIHPLLFERIYGAAIRDVTVERTAFAIRLALYAVFAVVLGATVILFDYAKVRAVVEDRRSMVGALAAGARFARRHARTVVMLFLANAGLFVGAALMYGLVAPGAEASVWAVLAVGQLYLIARLWIRLVFFASETALFQSRLAHAGYLAQAALPLVEPPLVERAVAPLRAERRIPL